MCTGVKKCITERARYLGSQQSTDSAGFSTVGVQPGSPVMTLPKRTLPLLVSLTRHRSCLIFPSAAEQAIQTCVSLYLVLYQQPV
jgi:hypothetical protein